MAEQGTGNGNVTLGILGEKVDNLTRVVEKLDKRIDPYILQCQRHEDRLNTHHNELFDSADGHSRIYAIQLQLKGLEDNTHAYIKQAQKSIETTITRRWAIIVVCIASVVGLAVQFLGRMIWPT